MSKRILSAALVLVLMLSVFPSGAVAATEVKSTEIIQFEDGSSLEIIIEKSAARGPSTVNGSKTYTFKDGSGNIDWQAKLTATFNYSGAWYTCSVANCTVTVNDSQWYVVSNNTIRSSNNAQTNLTMGLKVLGVTVNTTQYTIKLTCDNNGNLS